MNYTETFDQFASRITTMDLALYAGIGIVLWVLFKDKLSPVQKILATLLEKVKKSTPIIPVDVPSFKSITSTKEDVFFKLVVSWKQTRDLAVESGCVEAVRVADEMFPYLSPNICANNKDKSKWIKIYY